MRVKKLIQVNQADIDWGLANRRNRITLIKEFKSVPAFGTQCPIASALLRHGYEDPFVGMFRWSAGVTGGELPEIASKFIEHFDTTNEGKPFSFEIEYEVV